VIRTTAAAATPIAPVAMVKPDNTPRLPMMSFIAVIPVAAFRQINSELSLDK
jgi:hypothetical protein